MPSVEENRDVWGSRWDWSRGGDEWSAWWGGTEAMWVGAVLPRIHAFVPTGTMLEIGPGHGRWTHYLKDLSQRLVLVDLAPNCIDHCRERFAAADNIEYHVNDGVSLHMIPDGSVDFVFSFDSLVHVDDNVLAGYVTQLAKKLTADGAGFFHHSNLGAYSAPRRLAERLPRRVLEPLVRRGVVIDVAAWRDPHASAARFVRTCRAAGLRCISQEHIAWQRGPYLIDTLSVFTRPGSRWDRPLVSRRNRGFRAEGERMAALYSHPVST